MDLLETDWVKIQIFINHSPLRVYHRFYFIEVFQGIFKKKYSLRQNYSFPLIQRHFFPYFFSLKKKINRVLEQK